MLLPVLVSFALKPHMQNPQNHGNQCSSLQHPRMSFHSVFFLCQHLEFPWFSIPNSSLHHDSTHKNDRGNAFVGKREKKIQSKQQPKTLKAHISTKNLPKLCQVDYMEFCQHLSTFNKRDPMMIQSMIKYSVMELSGSAFWRGVYRGWWLLQKSGGLNQLSS